MLSAKHQTPSTKHLHAIGVLGGSFNPAHAGHIHISREACKVAGLTEIWWMVSPHNPLKNKQSLADYSERLEDARRLAAGEKRFKITDIEARLGTQYTMDTLTALAKRHPRTRFVWLMGADNLAQFHHWKLWDKFLIKFPILVLDRAPFSHAALRGKAALRAKGFRVQPRALTGAKAPAWAFVHMRRSPLSASAIRKKHPSGAGKSKV